MRRAWRTLIVATTLAACTTQSGDMRGADADRGDYEGVGTTGSRPLPDTAGGIGTGIDTVGPGGGAGSGTGTAPMVPGRSDTSRTRAPAR